MRKKPLSEQVVVVTGGTAGLGRAVALGAARRGASVVVAARGQRRRGAAGAGAAGGRAGRDGARRELESLGAQVLAVATDASDREQVEELVRRAIDRFGRIDTFVANQMVTVYSEVTALREDE